MEQNQPTTTKEKEQSWLEKLAAESYQAELIVSGVAIVGVSLLPGQIGNLVDYVLQHLSSEYFSYYYFIFAYLSFGVGIIYLSLILHFVARTLWIGMVGLHSVFPQGIIYDKLEHLSDDYREKMKADLPDFKRFLEKLDHFCSMIFAFAFGLASITVSFAILIGIALALTAILKNIFTNLPIQTTANVILLFLLGPMVIMSFFNLKVLREKEWVKKIHYPVAKKMSLIIFNVNYLPVTYITSIFSSNYKLKNIGLVFMISLFAMGGFLLASIMSTTNVIQLSHFNREPKGSRADKVEYFEYEDQLRSGDAILSPIIPSDQIKGAYLKVFVPIPRHLTNILNEVCNKFTPSSEDLKGHPRRKERRAHRLTCIQEQFQLKLDDTSLSNVRWDYYTHPHDLTTGIISYLSTDGWAAGRHTLTVIEPKSKNSEEESVERNILFLFEAQ